MDALKVEPYSDAHNSLEKGCSSPGQSTNSGICRACSVQHIRTRCRHHRSFVRHPWIILGTVALTWLLWFCGKRVFSEPHHVWYWENDSTRNQIARPPPPPPPADGDVDQCVSNANWTHYDQPPWAEDFPHGAEATFSLPLDSDALSLISKGGFQEGVVHIKQSDEVTDTVAIHVRVAYYVNEIFEHTTVCQIERADKDYGVGIFSPKLPHVPHDGPHSQLKFDITLVLPAVTGGTLSVKNLETRMPNYSQNVADLQKSVVFDSISLWSANGKLSVQSLTFDVGQFALFNGEIDGHFNALSSLDLRVMNGRIAPIVNMLHREGADPSHLSIRTMNGEINAEVSLASDVSTGGEFEVEAESKHGKVELKFADTPVDSILRCRAETTTGNLEIELDSAFEGTYSLQTLLGPKSVMQHEVEDPAGKGRHRIVSQSTRIGRVEGEVKWLDSDGSYSENEGYVILKALVSPIKLVL